jgi:hypothetical protein
MSVGILYSPCEMIINDVLEPGSVTATYITRIDQTRRACSAALDHLFPCCRLGD